MPAPIPRRKMAAATAKEARLKLGRENWEELDFEEEDLDLVFIAA